MADRTIALESELANKMFYLISAGQALEEQYMATMIRGFRVLEKHYIVSGDLNQTRRFAQELRIPYPQDM
jgi:hypothetical protein